MINQKETITAISTPIGEGAISIVRLSGKNSIAIINKIFSKDILKFKDKTAYIGKILDSKKNVVDEVILTLFKTPNSFTGEDIVEIACHGGILITQRVFEEVLNAGARPSGPGEFTMRAFLNKKIDLSQAEAIQDLISAKNKFALKAASNQLCGHLSKEIKKFQKLLIDIAAIMEVSLDFPEEGIDDAETKSLIDDMLSILKSMQELSDTFEDGKIIKAGVSICIAGSVNVGKSSLMNAILKKDRAIVTSISGTTRDVLKEDIKLNDMFYQLIDTAGIRKTTCTIEQEGIKRSRREQKNSDITLLVLDASKKLSEDDLTFIKILNRKKTIAIWNKIDISDPQEKIDFENVVKISAKNRIGLENLYKMIEKITFKSKISNDEIFITNKRHKYALDGAISYLKKALKDLGKGISFEFITIDIKSSLKELSKILGFDITEDILSSIFSNFCIGK
ncbi:MAG: tRNA modification GTPase MnmE [Candidatus Anoxychlamydiales bacterium]|nr:tRNA modification GTPase MnmE [Candidatus Anoxychlamydiales bacterium]